MKRALFLFLLAGGCGSVIDRAPFVWYDRAEIVCYDENCFECWGRGYVTCDPCGGSGGSACGCGDGEWSCSSCGGSGRQDDKDCSSCFGGTVSCSICGGDGRIECLWCGGRGRVHHLRPLPITEPQPSGEDAWPPVEKEVESE